MNRQKYSETEAPAGEDQHWMRLPVKQRCRLIGRVAHELADAADELVHLCRSPQRTDNVETIASELIPLSDALRFVARRGPRLLRPRHVGIAGRPAWLWGVTSVVSREPHGRVLIIGTWNYPLLLPGVQLAQALAAGNSVLLKPAPGAESATRRLQQCFHQAGVPAAAIQLLNSDPAAAATAIDIADIVVLTGSAATGRKVLAKAAETVTPAIVELSGCDAVIAMPTADHERICAAIEFGLTFNAGATCIGPRRLIVEDSQADELLERLVSRLTNCPSYCVYPAARGGVADTIDDALAHGAKDRTGNYDSTALRQDGTMYPLVLDQVDSEAAIASADLFAPVISVIRVSCIDQAIQVVNDCRYRLAASVFGAPKDAEKLAAELHVGSVTINDLVAPTADPRLPFGGRGESGFGVTRGEEGLLSMTVPKVTTRRRGKMLPHLSPRKESDAEALLGFLQMKQSGSTTRRLAGLRRLISSVKTSSASQGESSESGQPQKTHEESRT